MKLYKLIFSLILIISIGFVSCDEPEINDTDINILLDDIEYKLEWIDYRTNLEYWDFYTTGDADSLAFYNKLYNYVVSDKKIERALSQGRRELADEVNIRRWELINNQFNSPNVESSADISNLRDSLSQIEVAYRPSYKSEKISKNELYRIYQTNRDRLVREEAYRSYCSVGDELADGLGRLFRLRNQKAKKNGFNNYFKLSFKEQGLNFNDYRNLIVKLDSVSRQPYKKILNNISKKLKVNQLQIWDLAYSYSQITQEVDKYFPVDSQLIIVKNSLKGIGINLDKLPIYYDLESREGKSEFAYAFLIKPPEELRLMANLNPGFYSTKTLLHEIGHTVHAAHILQDNFLFRSWLSGIWMEAMAQTLANMMLSKEWLVQYAHIPEARAKLFLDAKQDLGIIYLRTTLMRLQFELAVYDNPNRDLNKLYWELFEKYMMLSRHDDIKPWAMINHYITHPVYLQNYLYADIISAQTLEYLENNYDEVAVNSNTKSFLVQNYFRFGSRYDWEKLLKRGTDEELNENYLISRLGLN